MHFSRIRLSGFKSFVDPTELHIENGLTGVVGPNGCGKSNLLESIRWVMGENRVKNMRGSGMDDVIFAGTNARPPRNLADVTLTLDNSDRRAPAAFNDDDILEISRRIERESGSAYRINGREVRAKDVQLLFADAATGAHSPSLVSQGRIGEMISAKPQDRRALLEEAAGISGLHARRKEAESRLRSAERNLLRLDDVMVQMDGQIAGLKRQARQATRYRNVSGDIERALGLLLYVRWKAAAEQAEKLKQELTVATAEVARLTEIQTKLSVEQTELASKLPDLRQAEAEAAAAVHRITVAREQLEDEEARLRNKKSDLELRLQQVSQDRRREEESVSDATSALSRLSKERDELAQALEAETDAEEKAGAALNSVSQEASAAEEALDKLNARAAAGEARRDTLELEVNSTERRHARLVADLERLAAEMVELAESDEAAKALQDAEQQHQAAETALETARSVAEGCETAHTNARDARDKIHDVLTISRTDLSALEAEARSLSDLIASASTDEGTPIADALKVSPGYETALGAALGDDLEAPEGDDGSRRWVTLAAIKNAPDLPKGVQSLAELVKGPKALARRLSQVGIVDETDGEKLSADLRPGQRLVTLEGAVWRWDGFVSAADAPSLAAVRLAQKNRLAELEGEIATAQAILDGHAAEHDVALATLAETRDAEQAARGARSAAEQEMAKSARHVSEMEREAGQRSTRVAALEETRERVTRDAEEAAEAHKVAATSLAGLEDPVDLRTEIQTLKIDVGEKRGALADARAEYDGLRRRSEDRKRRIESLNMELSAWTSRASSGQEQLDELSSRETEIKDALEGISTDPRIFEGKRKALIEELHGAEGRRQDAADNLANADSILSEKDRELRVLQENLGVEREGRVRVETSLEATNDRQDTIAHEIGEEFQCPPTHLLEKIGHKDPDNLPLLEVIEKRLDRLKTERERLGAVNLRAAEELEEMAQQVETLESEKADLVSAIGRLRHAIGSLNKEGRERLVAAFEDVNAHFGELFTTLFGGGEAHLELTESDDPLAAGLEIYASPPAKSCNICPCCRVASRP